MTEPDSAGGVIRGSIPVYMSIGTGEPRQVGAFIVPDGGDPPTNAEIARLLHQIADQFANAPEGTQATGVAMMPRL